MKKASENKKAILLQKWLSGDVNYQEEQLLRQWALDDPFFAEAMEGYDALPQAAHSVHLQQLRVRLNKTYSSGKNKRGLVVPLGLSMAASVMLVLGAMMWFWFQPAQNAIVMESAPLERMVKPFPKADATTTNPAIDDKLLESEVAETIGEEQALKQSVASTPLAQAAPSPPQAPVASQVPVKKREEVVPYNRSSEPETPAEKDQYENIEAGDFTIAQSPQIAPAPKDAPPLIDAAEEHSAEEAVSEYGVADATTPTSGESKKEKPADFRKITGHVYDEEGLPLIGANVIAEGTQNGTLTDQMGRFEMAVQKTIPNLRINYLGYNSLLVPLSQKDSLSIIMNASDLALDEVVVTGFDKASKIKKMRAIRAQPAPSLRSSDQIEEASMAKPRGGFDKFEKYLRQNLRYPDAAKNNGIKGAVKVEFKIGPDGIPTDLKIRQSLGFGCDEEAIRLLREGPKWKTKPNQTTDTTTISILF